MPPDLELLIASTERTGRLIVAAEDREFAGFARAIQGHVVQALPGTPSMALGQKNVPGIGQSLVLEEATILTATQIVQAAEKLVQVEVGGTGGWSWIPPRYFVD